MQWEGYYQHWIMPAWGYTPIAIAGGLLLVAALWSIVWKGFALWRAAQRGDKKWFVALLVINTLGILEILYLYVFSKDSNKTE